MKWNLLSHVRLFASPYTVHGILQVKILEWVAYPFSRRSSWPKNELGSPALQADSLPTELSRKPRNQSLIDFNLILRLFIFIVKYMVEDTTSIAFSSYQEIQSYPYTHTLCIRYTFCRLIHICVYICQVWKLRVMEVTAMCRSNSPFFLSFLPPTILYYGHLLYCSHVGPKPAMCAVLDNNKSRHNTPHLFYLLFSRLRDLRSFSTRPSPFQAVY